ncbi:hypothetical protein PGTUg99_008759 [Puccinia graminis f. sp. tritici]|uniref:Uncharacterized protein n=1 Tax=Puccinia graminis f. sp. tritici TaxID=56615 RepID=A0A5B0LR42_PUCGR|nr:hypothetical protein PGTUg99_008759 [Puccinia graminis f. sp. tritici]
MDSNKTTRSKSSARKDPETLPGESAPIVINAPKGKEANPPKEAEINITAPTSEPPDSDGEGSVDLIAKNPSENACTYSLSLFVTYAA